MPTHAYKPVKTLYDIARSATSQLVLSSCNNIQELYPNCGPDLNCNGLTTPSQQSVKSVQDLLRENLPATVFEDVFHTILDEERISEISDMRIVYSIFVYHNVVLRKLRITNGINLNYDNQMTNPGHLLFWINRAPMLSKLDEVDMREVSSDYIVLAFCCSCPNLTSMKIKYVSSPKILASVFRLCNQLRTLWYKNPFSGTDFVIDALMSLDANHKLKLRNLSGERIFTPDQVQVIVDRCPELQDLDLSLASSVIYQIIAESTLKLRIHHFVYPCDSGVYNPRLSCNDAYGYYLSCKGEYITELLIEFGSVNIMRLLETISDRCHNLISLCVLSYWKPNTGEEYMQYRISFPKLEVLQVLTFPQNLDALFAQVFHCLKDAEELRSLSLSLLGNYGETIETDWDAKIIHFFATNPRMKQLKSLAFETSEEMISTELAKRVYNTCTNLTRFEIKGLDVEAKKYVLDLERETKAKNLEITITC